MRLHGARGFSARSTSWPRCGNGFEEQAELERAAGVATLSGSGHRATGGYRLRHPETGQQVGYQMVSFFGEQEGRVFLDLLRNPVIHDYAAHLFRGEPYNLATHNGVILHKGSSSQVLHADQQAIPLVLDRPVMFAMMICLYELQNRYDSGGSLLAPGSQRRPTAAVGRQVGGRRVKGQLRACCR